MTDGKGSGMMDGMGRAERDPRRCLYQQDETRWDGWMDEERDGLSSRLVLR